MNRVFTILVVVLLSVSLWAQAPQSFSYQAVIRGTSNSLVVNKPVGIKVSLLQGSENGTAIYVETHKPTSNENGLVSIAIGGGNKDASSNAFITIDWSKGPYFIKTETDPTGGTSYSLSSVSQLLSVPYANYAGNGIKRISANSDTIFLSNNNYYINKSSFNTGNNSIPSGGGQGQVLTMCDGELKWTNRGICTGKITTLDCNYTIVSSNVFVKNDYNSTTLKFNYSGGNSGFYDFFSVQSTGVLGLTAKLNQTSNLLNNGDGSFNVIIDGTPTAVGKANFTFVFCGKSCSFIIDVIDENKGVPGSNITDVDGNVYKTVVIGSQTWMAENLKVSKYNNGTTIPNITDSAQWSQLTTGAWCYYSNDLINNAKYGKLYNWYAVSPTTNGNKNVCPTGWHVPTDAEWTVLTNYLGGETVAGGKMKEVGTTSWNSPNIDATNTSLFTGLPGGYRYNFGYYGNIGNFGNWWSSTEYTTNSAFSRFLYGSNGNATRGSYVKYYGLSVRCLRD